MSAIRGIGLVALFVIVLAAGVALGVAGRAKLMAAFDRVMHPHAAVKIAGAGAKQFWTCAMHPQVIKEQPGDCPICHMALVPMTMELGGAGDKRVEGRERKIKYWWDPMYKPPYISDRPGKSPMGMDLLPVYEDEIPAGGTVKIDPVVVQNMGVRVAQVVQGPMRAKIRTVGYLMEPEQNHVEINLRVSGWIQKLHANYDGKEVAAGDPLFDLYSPDLQVAVDELIAARHAKEGLASDADAAMREAAVALYSAAQRRLELLGLDPLTVTALAKLDKAPATVTFNSPMAGHVTEKTVIEGSAVKAGDRLMKIANRMTMWLEVQVYENQLPFVKLGTPIKATTAALPGTTLEGTVSFIYPHIDAVSRTAMVRITVPNPNHALHEGMYATVGIDERIADNTLMVPREAVLDSGTRQLVFVAEAEGHFSPRKVTVGASGNEGMVQILSGLMAGETVVTSGQFLLDSESRTQEAIAKHSREQLLSPSAATLPAGGAK